MFALLLGLYADGHRVIQRSNDIDLSYIAYDDCGFVVTKQLLEVHMYASPVGRNLRSFEPLLWLRTAVSFTRVNLRGG